MKTLKLLLKRSPVASLTVIRKFVESTCKISFQSPEGSRADNLWAAIPSNIRRGEVLESSHRREQLLFGVWRMRQKPLECNRESCTAAERWRVASDGKFN